MVTKSPIIKRLRRLLPVHREEDKSNEEDDGLSPVGSQERVDELRVLRDQVQRLLVEAAAARKAALRVSS